VVIESHIVQLHQVVTQLHFSKCNFFTYFNSSLSSYCGWMELEVRTNSMLPQGTKGSTPTGNQIQHLVQLQVQVVVEVEQKKILHGAVSPQVLMMVIGIPGGSGGGGSYGKSAIPQSGVQEVQWKYSTC
jgi:hypothetical protein